MEIARRDFLAMLLAATASPAWAESGALAYGKATPFSFEDLVIKAKKMAREAYAPRVLPKWTDKVLDAINYDQHGDIRHTRNRGLFANTESPVTFFHLGRFFRRPVSIHAWENGMARRVRYSKSIFSYKPTNPGALMPDDAGFAGFRIMNADETDWCVFLGASYFRCAGDANQYGASARAVAIDTAPWKLIEIPTTNEYMDNIVCMWTPARTPEPGDELRYSYNIFWSVEDRLPNNLARCVATRLTMADEIPEAERKPGDYPMTRTITVEFEGKSLEGLDPSQAEMVLWVSRGRVPTRPEAAEYGVWPQADGSMRQWRAIFSVRSAGDEPIDIRLFLRYGDKTLTETWLYQLHPTQYVS